MSANKKCECGWERPLVSLTTIEGQLPPTNVIPIYNCPRCGITYVPVEISEERAKAILRDLSHLAARRAYSSPTLRELGTVPELTRGMGGSAADLGLGNTKTEGA
jgi:hypothetical protein